MAIDEPLDERIADYLEDRLDPAQVSALEERLQSVGRLEELAQLRRIVAALWALPRDPVPAGLVDRIMHSVAAESRRPAPFRRLLPWFLAAGTAAAAGLLLYVTLPTLSRTPQPNDSPSIELADLPRDSEQLEKLSAPVPPPQERASETPPGEPASNAPLARSRRALSSDELEGQAGGELARKSVEVPSSPVVPERAKDEAKDKGTEVTGADERRAKTVEKEQAEEPKKPGRGGGLLGGLGSSRRARGAAPPASRPSVGLAGAPPSPVQGAGGVPILILALSSGPESLSLDALRKKGLEVEVTPQSHDLRGAAETPLPAGETHHVLRLTGERTAVLQAVGELTSQANSSRTALVRRPLPAPVEERTVFEILLIVSAPHERP